MCGSVKKTMHCGYLPIGGIMGTGYMTRGSISDNPVSSDWQQPARVAGVAADY